MESYLLYTKPSVVPASHLLTARDLWQYANTQVIYDMKHGSPNSQRVDDVQMHERLSIW